MNYEGPLFGKIGRRLVPLKMTSKDVDAQSAQLADLQECRDAYREMCSRLQECVQTHQIGLGGEKLDALVCDEIQTMREAIAEAYQHARWLASNSSGLSYRTAQAILSRLRPFVKATQ